MKSTQDVTACVVDMGIFGHIAHRLAADYRKVYYHKPWEIAMPRISEMVIGDGYPEIEWVESIWDVADECDLFVFPDIGLASLQEELVKRGKAVWGSRHADGLEARRGLFLKSLESTNLPVPKYEAIKGITNLRLFLKENEDKYIKVSTYRGDFETFHFKSMDEDETVLDCWSVKLGPLRDQITFYVFDPIDTEIEDGCDSWCIDGQWPKTVMHCMECKDRSALGTFQKFKDLPKEVRVVNEEFGPVLAQYGYRGFFSTEVRITKDGESNFIDPTCRAASPISQMQCDMIGNLGEIVWRGANGEMVEPEPAARFGVQAIFKVDRDEWFVLDIPPELQEHVVVEFSCMVDGKICVPPDKYGFEEIGWLKATGNTIEGAIDNLKSYEEQLPDGIHVETASMANLLKEVQNAQDKGMTFTNAPVPEPETVVSEK